MLHLSLTDRKCRSVLLVGICVIFMLGGSGEQIGSPATTSFSVSTENGGRVSVSFVKRQAVPMIAVEKIDMPLGVERFVQDYDTFRVEICGSDGKVTGSTTWERVIPGTVPPDNHEGLFKSRDQFMAVKAGGGAVCLVSYVGKQMFAAVVSTTPGVGPIPLNENQLLLTTFESEASGATKYQVGIEGDPSKDDLRVVVTDPVGQKTRYRLIREPGRKRWEPEMPKAVAATQATTKPSAAK